jgi:CRISPR/Cas system-associated exonuclease Cas4 (RecB family)
MFFTEDKRRKNLFWLGIHPSLRGWQWKNPSLSDTLLAGENEIYSTGNNLPGISSNP